MELFMRNKLRRGVTLIELLVVLAILAAIAGITVPLVSDATDEAHTGNSVANLSNVNTAVATQSAKSGSYPDNLDALMSGTAGSEAITDILSGEAVDLAAALSLIALDADQADSLTSAGITTLEAFEAKGDLDTASRSYTFDPYSDSTFAIANGLQVVSIDSDIVNEQLGAPAADTYVVFGYGARNTSLGEYMLECPVHYPHGGEVAEGYSRVLCVFKLGAGEEEPATYVGSIANDEGEFVGVNGHLAEHFN